ncbi:MAG TPA: asparagine synthase (glutamine-hydrolyzing) [Candidatus Deferrimicrobiaceae bacterium]|jgi:asparagine synthase (glutamine-hydrolysing)
MCGIAGIYAPNKELPDEGILRRMLFQIRHRGPDEFGTFVAPEIGLAHARLSIIDLETGQQPMCTLDGRFWIVFNGEIFNYLDLRNKLVENGHHFRTKSDTEVILHLYEDKGAATVTDLNGQFAFAIWDQLKKELFLARDRFGIRPLYYMNFGTSFVFGSEIKAIFAHPATNRKINPIAIDDIFTFWFPLSPNSAFQDVLEIPPAHYMTVTSAGTRLVKYWNLPEETDLPGAFSVDDYAEQLRDLMVDSVRLQLQADVPVGVFLSGGLDSSVIASIVSHYTPNDIHTFSISFQDPEFDETDKQRQMTEYLRSIHAEVNCKLGSISDIFREIVWHTEVPILRTAPAPIFLLAKLLRKNNYKVALTGEGADEVLAGYDLFKEAKIRRFIRKSPQSKSRSSLIRRLYPYLRNSPTRHLSIAQYFFNAQPDPFGATFDSHANRWNLTALSKNFFMPEFRRCIREPFPEKRIEILLGKTIPSDPLSVSQRIELQTFLPSYLLSSQGDRMLMANSVEGRFPFLDHRIVEFGFRVPPNLRMRGLREKYILRRAMADILPATTRNLIKQPYRAPDAKSFFEDPGNGIIDEFLSKFAIAKGGIFNPDMVSKLVDKCRTSKVLGFKDNSSLIGILSTQILIDRFINHFQSNDEIPSERTKTIRYQSHGKDRSNVKN